MAAKSTSRRPFADLEDVHGPTDRLFAEMEKGERGTSGACPWDVIERDDKYPLTRRTRLQAGSGQDRGRRRRADRLRGARGVRRGEQGPPPAAERRYGSASRSILPSPEGVTPTRSRRRARTASSSQRRQAQGGPHATTITSKTTATAEPPNTPHPRDGLPHPQAKAGVASCHRGIDTDASLVVGS